MRYILGLVLFTLVSCVNIEEKKVECPSDVIECAQTVADKEYILNEYDCSNMSFDLAWALHVRGYDSRIIVYKVNNWLYHAIVEVHVKGEFFYFDPTLENFRRDKPKNPLYIFTPTQVSHLQYGNLTTEQTIFEFLQHLLPKEVEDTEDEE